MDAMLTHYIDPIKKEKEIPSVDDHCHSPPDFSSTLHSSLHSNSIGCVSRPTQETESGLGLEAVSGRGGYDLSFPSLRFWDDR